MLVAAPIVRPLVNFSAIAGLETIVFQIETAVGVHDFVGTVAVLREAPEFVCDPRTICWSQFVRI